MSGVLLNLIKENGSPFQISLNIIEKALYLVYQMTFLMHNTHTHKNDGMKVILCNLYEYFNVRHVGLLTGDYMLKSLLAEDCLPGSVMPSGDCR